MSHDPNAGGHPPLDLPAAHERPQEVLGEPTTTEDDDQGGRTGQVRDAGATPLPIGARARG